MEENKGLLLKRKDFLGVDEEAGSHPNRTYYFKKYSDLDNILITCSKSLEAFFLSSSSLLLLLLPPLTSNLILIHFLLPLE